MALFRGNEDHHGTHGTPQLDDTGLKWGIRSTARTVKAPVTESLWRDHLSGKRPLGVVPITSENKCSWGSIDVDEYDVDILDIVKRAQKLPLVPCRSKSGGLHLFLFLTEEIDAKDMQLTLRDMAASIGQSKSEIFPKQIQLNTTQRTDYGSWMVMPYFGSDFDGKLKMQYGLKPTGAEMTLSEFIGHAEKARVTPEELQNIRIKSTKRPKSGSKPESGSTTRKPKPPFYDGPPCLAHLVEGGEEAQHGGRNNMLFHMGVYFKKKFPDNWQAELEAANGKYVFPPLPSSDIESVIKSLNKKDYLYKCKDTPMVNHCDPVTCRMKKFGVGAGGTYPVIEELRVVRIDPVIWLATVEGKVLILSTEDLQNYIRFHRACMEVINVCFAMIRQDVWLSIVSDAMQNMDKKAAVPDEYTSKDIGRFEVFKEILETFLTNKQRGQKVEDILSGRPWENEETEEYYFSLSSLEKFLHREGMKDITRTKIVTMIKQLDGKHEMLRIKKKVVNVWKIPKKGNFEEQPSIDTPDLEDDKI